MKKIYINLPVKSLAKSIAFYEAIGCVKQDDFSNDDGAGMKWSDEIYFMLLTHTFTQNFIQTKEIADASKVANAIYAFEFESKDEVNTIVSKALEAWAEIYKNKYTEQFEFMYSTSIVDPDGYIIEAFYMDTSKFPTPEVV